jgi:hypothetical protein
VTSQAGQVPDAVAALVQGVLDDHPAADRAALGRLIVRALRRDGWDILPARQAEPESRRPTK